MELRGLESMLVLIRLIDLWLRASFHGFSVLGTLPTSAPILSEQCLIIDDLLRTGIVMTKRQNLMTALHNYMIDSLSGLDVKHCIF